MKNKLLLASFAVGSWLFASGAGAATYPTIGLGLNVGSEATYGNAFVLSWRAYDFGELEAGFGYNSTGPKIGVGNTFIYNLTRSIGLTFGNALVYSGGTEGDVEVDATFTPEGSNKEEEITAVKSYELSPAVLLGFAVGGYWDFLKFLRFNARLCYNFPIWGNEVTLGEKTTYDKDVEITNEQQFEEELDREAEDEVEAGGLGILMGAAFVF